MLRNQSQFQISNTREKLEKSNQIQNQNVEMFPSRIVPLVSKYMIIEFYYDNLQSRLL